MATSGPLGTKQTLGCMLLFGMITFYHICPPFYVASVLPHTPSALIPHPQSQISSQINLQQKSETASLTRCVSQSNSMAFVSSPNVFFLRQARPNGICNLRMADEPPPPGKKLPVTNSPPQPGRKLIRNKSDAKSNTYATGSAGDMVGGPPVGSGMGPRRGVKDKKVTKAAAIQNSRSFADAWADQNQGRIDVWLIIGIITLLTPLVILAWAVATGVIPTGGLFEEY